MRLIHFITQPLSGLVLHNSQRVRVLVVAEGKTLLQRSSFGHQRWSIPGGGVDRNEKPVAAAVRELEEEVGVVANQQQLTLLGSLRTPARRNWPMLNLIFYVLELDAVIEPRITRPHEILEAGWFALDALPDSVSKTLHQAMELRRKKEQI